MDPLSKARLALSPAAPQAHIIHDKPPKCQLVLNGRCGAFRKAGAPRAGTSYLVAAGKSAAPFGSDGAWPIQGAMTEVQLVPRRSSSMACLLSRLNEKKPISNRSRT